MRNIIIFLISTILLCSCNNDEDCDRILETTICVSHKTDIYYDFFDSEKTFPMVGMIISEKYSNEWHVVPFSYINGFTYEKGNSYELFVEKRIYSNPPADGPLFSYKLIRIISQNKVV